MRDDPSSESASNYSFFLSSFHSRFSCLALFSLSRDWLVSATPPQLLTHHLLSGDAKALTFEALHFGRSTSFLFLRSDFCASAVACRHASYARLPLYERVWIIDLLQAGETASSSYCRGPYSYE
ncbi:hypothetical protein GGI42DRAFT_305171 [Trichoderma sp. SZMC 28013]